MEELIKRNLCEILKIIHLQNTPWEFIVVKIPQFDLRSQSYQSIIDFLRRLFHFVTNCLNKCRVIAIEITYE